jgi:hypothetical protein
VEEQDITAALDVIHAASKGNKVWGLIKGETQEEVIPRIVENYTNNAAVGAHVVAMVIDEATPIETKCLTMAITGNGPTAEANAKYIVASFDPVIGWEAALREVRRLQRENSELLSSMKLRHA